MGQQSEPAFSTKLAERVIAASQRRLSAAAIGRSQQFVADTLAVALAGAGEDCVTILGRTPGVATAPGQSVVWGTPRRTSSLDAALINATASHALDYDDLCAVFGGHHSAPLVAPLLALADEARTGGLRLLQAYAAGVETEVRLARALLPEHYDKGWHPTSTIGVFGVVAACSVLLGLSTGQTANAMSIAASMSSGIKANFGSMTKPLHVGLASRSGLLATLMAQRGFDAGRDAFGDKQGFFSVYNGAGRFDEAKALENWYDPPEVLGETVGIKQFPCCGSTHASISAALALRGRAAVEPAMIDTIEVFPNKDRLTHTDKPHPRTPLEAKFSVQYVVARALLDGPIRLDHFSQESIAQPQVVKLLSRISAQPHPTMTSGGPQAWGAEVKIRLRNGEALSERVDNMACRDAAHPMSETERWQKFDDCAARTLGKDRTRQLYEMMNRMSDLDDCRQMTSLLAGGEETV